MSPDLTLFSGPGFSIGGLKGQEIQADGPFNWAASSTFTPQMGKGIGKGHTVLAQIIRLVLRYTAAPGAVSFTDAQLASFKNALLTRISGSTSRGPIVDSSEVQGGGDIDQRNRVGLRYSSQGTLDSAGGTITLGASGVLVVDVVIPHANANTGITTAPDTGLLENRSWQVATGIAAPSLAGNSITITGGQILTLNVVIKDRPGAKAHLSYKRVTQSDAVDTLEPAVRLCHIVTGSSAPTYAAAVAALDDGGTSVDVTADAYSATFAGVNPFNDQGYCNNALVWQSFMSRFDNGAVPVPGQERGVSGPQSYAMVPLYTWNGRAAGDYQAGPVGVVNAGNMASASRIHDWIAVVGL